MTFQKLHLKKPNRLNYYVYIRTCFSLLHRTDRQVSHQNLANFNYSSQLHTWGLAVQFKTNNFDGVFESLLMVWREVSLNIEMFDMFEHIEWHTYYRHRPGSAAGNICNRIVQIIFLENHIFIAAFFSWPLETSSHVGIGRKTTWKTLLSSFS